MPSIDWVVWLCMGRVIMPKHSAGHRQGSQGRDRPVLVAVITAVAGILGTGITALVTLHGTSQPSPQTKDGGKATPIMASIAPTIPSASTGAKTGLVASILEPSPGAQVPLCTSAFGYVVNLPADRSVWLFIQIPDQSDRPGRWYALGKLTPESNGYWSTARFQIGDPGPGRPYWLELFWQIPPRWQ